MNQSESNAVVTAVLDAKVALVALLDERFQDYAAIERTRDQPPFSNLPKPTVFGITSQCIHGATHDTISKLKAGQPVVIRWDTETNRVTSCRVIATAPANHANPNARDNNKTRTSA